MADDPNPTPQPPNPAPTPQPPAPAPTPTPDPEPPNGPITFRTQEELNKRLERAERAGIRKLGFDDPAKVKEIIENHAKLQAEAEEQRLQQLSEVEREREQRIKLEQEAARAVERAEEAEHKAYLFNVFAEKGVANFEYAYFKTVQALGNLDEGQELDPHEFVDTMMADGRERAALGIAPPVQTVGVTDTATGREVTPPSPGAAPEADVMGMSREQFHQHMQSKHGYSGL